MSGKEDAVQERDQLRAEVEQLRAQLRDANAEANRLTGVDLWAMQDDPRAITEKARIEAACEIWIHSYEHSFTGKQRKTDADIDKTWAAVLEETKQAMRAAMAAVLHWLDQERIGLDAELRSLRTEIPVGTAAVAEVARLKAERDTLIRAAMANGAVIDRLWEQLCGPTNRPEAVAPDL